MEKKTTNSEVEEFIGGGNCGSQQNEMNGGNPFNMSFIEYMTTFTSDEKSKLLNLIQYGSLSILPIVLVLKLLKMYVPEEDSTKSSLEIGLSISRNFIYSCCVLHDK